MDGSAVDILLLTITHPDIATPYRISSDPTTRIQTDPELLYGTISNSNTYYFLPFRWVLPEDGDDVAPTLKFTIDNFSTELITILRTITTPATVTGQIVSSAALNTVEMTFPNFDLTTMNYDEGKVEITCVIDSLVNIPIPAGSFTPQAFGGLF